MCVRRPPRPGRVAGAAACMALLGCAACGSSSVEVPAPTRGPAECAALVDALPDTVDGKQRRRVEPADALAAAWGDPAIVLRCGVAEPGALTPSSPCAEVNRVGWFAERVDAGYRFTTIGRSANVQVEVPYDHEPAADALVDIAAAVRDTVPETQPCV